MTLNGVFGAAVEPGKEGLPRVGAAEQGAPERPRIDLPGVHQDAYVGSIAGPGEEGYDPVSLTERGARAAIRKAAESLDEARRSRLNEVLRQVGDLDPHVFSALKRLVQARVEANVPPFASFADSLAGAAETAEGAVDPKKALEKVLGGLANAPAGTEDEYLAAAAGVLGAEAEALRRAAGGAVPAPVEVDPQAGVYRAGRGAVSVEVDLSLFFEVSDRTSVRAAAEGGDGGARAYYEATREVTARFSADFSLSISTVGDYLGTADVLSKVDPKLFDDFNAAVAGLAGLDDDSLERFVAAAKALFGALDEATGDTDVLDSTGAELVETARAFVHGVRAAAEKALPGLEVSKIFDVAGDSDGTRSLLAMLSEGAAKADPNDETVRALLHALSGAENAASAQAEAPATETAADLLAALAAGHEAAVHETAPEASDEEETAAA